MVATVSFVAMVTGVSLHLHLLGHDHQDKHDLDNCSVCQQLLVTPGKFITEPESSLPDYNPQKDNIQLQTQPYVIAFHFEPFRPRPPPLFLKS